MKPDPRMAVHKVWWVWMCFISDADVEYQMLVLVTYDLMSGAVEAEPRSMTIRERCSQCFRRWKYVETLTSSYMRIMNHQHAEQLRQYKSTARCHDMDLRICIRVKAPWKLVLVSTEAHVVQTSHTFCRKHVSLGWCDTLCG